jgi:hypothetical protein
MEIHCDMITFVGHTNVRILLFDAGLQRLQSC